MVRTLRPTSFGVAPRCRTGRWISDAEVAEVPHTAFAATHDRITARLVVRRVKDARYPDALFDYQARVVGPFLGADDVSAQVFESAAGNLVVASGQKSEAELLTPGERPLLQLLRFSQLSPHPHSGGFSGEIRHGYLIEPSGKRTPLKGGSLSGVVFDAFRRAWFSQERAVHGRTHAPRSVRLDRVQVTGG